MLPLVFLDLRSGELKKPYLVFQRSIEEVEGHAAAELGHILLGEGKVVLAHRHEVGEHAREHLRDAGRGAESGAESKSYAVSLSLTPQSSPLSCCGVPCCVPSTVHSPATSSTLASSTSASVNFCAW